MEMVAVKPAQVVVKTAKAEVASAGADTLGTAQGEAGETLWAPCWAAGSSSCGSMPQLHFQLSC